MNITPVDIVGFAGVSLIVVTYFLSQIGRMDTTKPLYPALNAVGAALILFSLLFTFNIPSFFMELFWLGISVTGLIRSLMMQAKSKRVG